MLEERQEKIRHNDRKPDRSNYRKAPCRNFGRGKTCKFGDECRFIHDTNLENRPSTNDAPRGDLGKTTANPNGTAVQ